MARCSSCKRRRKFCGGQTHRGKCAECARLDLACVFLEKTNGARAQGNLQARRPRTHFSNSLGLSVDRRSTQTVALEGQQMAPAAVGVPWDVGTSAPACTPPHQTYADLNMQPVPVTGVEPFLSGLESWGHPYQPNGKGRTDPISTRLNPGQGLEWSESTVNMAAEARGSLPSSVELRRSQGHMNHNLQEIGPSPVASLGPVAPWDIQNAAGSGYGFTAPQQEQPARQHRPLANPHTVDDPSADLARFQRHIIFAVPGVFRLVFELERNGQGGENLDDLVNHESTTNTVEMNTAMFDQPRF
ncbi:uncharacterized protein EI90DRAFT_3152288 [Cantharellus anzutake]|uniref:uncharacterized protein n=1 Tax=Cantharellus anzutake TaxID=1750568 RepID=UPI0019048001|nr:uncharacterized protein EI90DRAFT_3152288 [Cantharellus anzutake]KAF8336822.1 hypothetical protein EI90DRAFT_3152288 [Cantharellus anzutake]